MRWRTSSVCYTESVIGCAIISFASQNTDVILRDVESSGQLEHSAREESGGAYYRCVQLPRQKGADPIMGAVQWPGHTGTIRSALAAELLFGRLANGGKVTVDVDAEGKVKLQFEEEAAAAV